MAGKPGLLAVAMSAIAGASVYFIRPTVSPLQHLRKLGLALVDPEGATDNIASLDYEFETVSSELADKYPVDLILLDDITTGFMSRDELAAIPTWRTRPAVQAGQIVSFSYGVNWSYRHIAEAIERITAGCSADPNIVRVVVRNGRCGVGHGGDTWSARAELPVGPSRAGARSGAWQG